MTTAVQQGLSTKKAVRLLCIAIVLVLISCIGASILQTDFGNVQITKITIPTDNGKWISGNLFRPVNASAENKVPLVITSHGYLNNNQMQDITAIELSRRGIAVIAMDAYFHGDSSATEDVLFTSIFTDAMGMIPLVEYAYYNLDYVDNTKIGVTGHSMGGMNTWSTLQYYGKLYRQALEEAAAPDSDGGSEITEAEQAYADAQNKVAAGFPTSQVAEQVFAIAGADMTVEKFYQDIHANIGVNLGYYDENGYVFTRKNSDLSGDCPESLYFINYFLPEEQQITSVEIGKFYGSVEEENLRVVYNPKEIHPWQHFSHQSSEHMCEFFTTAFQVETPLELGDQLWFYKELFNFIGLIGVVLAIVPMAALLLRVPCFADLRTSIPAPLPALTTAKSKVFFWGSWALSWVLSAVSYMPVARLDLKLFPDVSNYGVAAFFPQPTTNPIMLWAVFNGIVGLILFVLSYRLYGIKNGVTPQMWGIRTNIREFIKTLALAVCIFVGFYSFVMFSEFFFHTDFRIWTLDVRAFTADKLGIALQYWPFFFIFYAASSISVNSANRVAGQKEWVNLLICGLGNCLGAFIPLAHQYFVLFTTGLTPWAGDWLRPLVLLPLVVQLFVAAYISRYLFRETGKVWLGAMVNCLIIVMMAVANTATFNVL